MMRNKDERIIQRLKFTDQQDSQSKSISEFIDSDTLFNNLTSITPEELQQILEDIKKYGYNKPGLHPDHVYKYISILYPSMAINILALSRSSHWRNFAPDKLIEEIIAKFVARFKDTEKYSKDLFQAVEERECLEGVYYRLNYMILLSSTKSSTIQVRTRFGTYVYTEKNQKEAEPFNDHDTKVAIKEFLQNKNVFDDRINYINGQLKRIYREYDLEQSLLSWIGYIVLRYKIENAKKQRSTSPHDDIKEDDNPQKRLC